MSACIASVPALTAALARGSEIALSAYVLRPGSAVERALERAAERGAHVVVSLEGRPYDGGRGPEGERQANARTAAALRARGAEVRLTSPADVPVHMKAAVVDGTAFLDDRNWTSGGDAVISTDDPAEVAAVRAALAGESAGTPDLALDKARALALEAETIAAAPGDRIDVESESFGYSAVFEALRSRAEHGAHVRLLVAEREYRSRHSSIERGALRRLGAAGVDIRITPSDEKLCIAGDRGWVGSANATDAGQPMRDWGLRTSDPAVLAALQEHFCAAWASARRVTAV